MCASLRDTRGTTVSDIKFGLVKGIDKGRITTVKDLESLRFER